MKAVSSEDFIAAPVGHYCETNSFVYWYPDPLLNGVTLRGCPSAEDIRELTRLMDAMLRVCGQPHASLIDARALTGADPAAFAVLSKYVGQRWQAFASVIRRQALVRPVGLVGAVVAGFYQVLTPSFPVAVFESLDAALCWLGERESAVAEHALAELERANALDPLLVRLRQRLEADRAKISCATLARELGVSERTLQRRLHAAGTSFQEELVKARIRAAQTMMLTSEANLTAIALEVGCSSLQHYSALFRKVTGQSPSVWRKRKMRGRSVHSLNDGEPMPESKPSFA